MMRIDIFTLFPEQFASAMDSSIPKIAQEKSLLEINLVNWREFATDSHGTVDDRPYGGGSGMVLKVDILDKGLKSLLSSNPNKIPYVILLTPQGEKFTQEIATSIAKEDWLVLICGHYEGFDERIREHLVDRELSIGDYILSGGEIPAMVLTDTIARLLPGVLGNSNSTQEESFTDDLLEYPQYTRPEDYNGWKVPPLLLGGNHEEIKKWRQTQRLKRTKKKRSDLL